MKKMRLMLAVVLSMILLVQPVLAAAPENAAARKGAQGVYGLFAVTFEGYIVEPSGMTSVLGLYEDGTGFLTINNDGGTVSDWDLSGENISVTSGIDTMTGTLVNGIITLDYGEGSICYYAQSGTDTSSIPVMTTDEFAEAWAMAQQSDPVKTMAGTYRMSGGSFDGETVTEEQLTQMEAIGMTIRLILNEDGTGKLDLMGEVTELEWNPEKLTVGSEEIPFTYENGVLTLSQEDEYMTFVKMTEDAAKAEADGTAKTEDTTTPDPNSRAGYYKLRKMIEDDEETDATMLEMFGLEVYLVLNEDGSGRLSMFGTDLDLSWDNSNLTMYGEPSEYQYDAGVLTMVSGDTQLIFEYAGTADQAPAPGTPAVDNAA